MNKINKHIEIVRSTEKGLSSISVNSSHHLVQALSNHYQTVGISIINNLSDLDKLVELKPDLVFLGINFLPRNQKLGLLDNDKIWVTDYLEEHGIAYTGSARIAHELEIDKSIAKRLVASVGLRTSPFFIITTDQSRGKTDPALTFPVFIKPTSRGGGLGIDSKSKVNNHDELWAKVSSIASTYNSDSIIESYLPGREFTVAILKNVGLATYSVMPLELIAVADENGDRILSNQAKKDDTESAIAITDASLKLELSKFALDVFTLINGRDFGRIDIRLDELGRPNFLEANLIPSLTPEFGNFPKACALNIGLDYESMVLRIISLAFDRYTDKSPKKVETINLSSVLA